MRNHKLLLLAADIFALFIGYGLGVVALVFYTQYFEQENFLIWWNSTGLVHALVQIFFCGLAIFRLQLKGLYSRRLPFWDELRSILASLTYVAITMGIVVLLAKWPFSRVIWVVSWIAAMFLIPILRHLLRAVLMKYNLWQIPVSIIGTGGTAVQALKAFQSEKQLGFRLEKFIHIPELEGASEIPSEFRVVEASLAEIPRAIAQDHFIVVALESKDRGGYQELIENLSLLKNELHVVPPLVGVSLLGLEAHHFFSHEVLLMRSKNNLSRIHKVIGKRLFDLAVSTLLMILLAPLLAYIAFQIRRSGPGVLFKQRRIGRNGELFSCYKFRTMVPNAEEILKDLLDRDPIARKEWDEKTKITNDPRITPIGHFLRRTSLDELPQLWNVLSGDMSLVGPRPILQHEVEKYGDRIKFYKIVRPGLTGLWQVSGRSDTDYNYRVHLDSWYVKNWALWYDIAILFKTVEVVTSRKGAY